jgi:putative hydrolase of the HAD superfamily
MNMILTTNNVFVFDLDDTLYSERDFENSGIEFVCNSLNLSKNTLNINTSKEENWVQKIISKTNNKFTKDYILTLYRNHIPNITLYNDARIFLDLLKLNKIEMSLITDGRSITQRNKLKALNIDNYFNKIIISEEINSEKPSELNFKKVMNVEDNSRYVYIGDNPIKDFLIPNLLGWISICRLDNGFNVHKQNFNISNNYMPKHIIKSFNEIILKHEN